MTGQTGGESAADASDVLEAVGTIARLYSDHRIVDESVPGQWV